VEIHVRNMVAVGANAPRPQAFIKSRRLTVVKESTKVKRAAGRGLEGAAQPNVVTRAQFEEQLNALRVREKDYSHLGDAIAAERRRLPMVEVDPQTELIGPQGTLTLLDTFQGRKQLIAYYFMWHTGRPAQEQCQGCTWVTAHIGELEYLHARDVTFAVFAQGPFPESIRYRDFMGWQMPWYSAAGSLQTLLSGRTIGRMHLVCYLLDRSRVYETYWTTSRGVEAMDNSYRLLDLTVYGRQERHEISPGGWPQAYGAGELTVDGRPLTQWARIEGGRSDDLKT
jgi:predicted dithiol-disulfide oxidoreductase (DUF899 family)